MKKFCLFCAAVLLLNMTGCSFRFSVVRNRSASSVSEPADPSSEKAESDSEEAEEESSESSLAWGEYAKADYKKYCSNDESLQDDLIYVEGTALSYIEAPDQVVFGVVLEDEKGQKWLMFMGKRPDIAPQKAKEIVGKQVKIYGEYCGYSEIDASPMVWCHKTEGDDFSFTMADMHATTEEYQSFWDTHGTQGVYADYPNGVYQGQYISFTGTVTNFKKAEYTTALSFNLTEQTSRGPVTTYFSHGYNLVFDNMDDYYYATHIPEGDTVRIYCTVEADNVLSIRSLAKVEEA